MLEQSIRNILTLSALALISTASGLAQSSTAPEPGTIPVANNALDDWQAAQQAAPSKGKLFVVTLDQPNRRQTCRIKSFTKDKLVCSHAIGGSQTFLPPQVLALILPGDGGLRLPLWLGFNAGLGASIWGTVVLAAACPACAVGTVIAAIFFFGAAGAVVYGDNHPERVLYRGPRPRPNTQPHDIEPM